MKISIISVLIIATFLHNIVPSAARSYQPDKEILIAQRNSAEAIFQQGKQKYEQRKYKEAIASFDGAIRLKPDFIQALVYRGLAYKKIGKLEEAINDYTQALALSAKDQQMQSLIHYNRGLAYSDLRKTQESIDDFTLAIQFNSQDAEAYYQRGFILAEKSNIQAAISDFSKAIALDRSYLSAYAQRGITLNGYLGNLPAATSDFIKAVRFKPKDADDYWNRGSAHSALGNFKAALADFTEALRLNPNYSRAYSSRVGIRYLLGDQKGAKADLAQAIKIMLSKNLPDAGVLNALVTLSFHELESEPELLQQISDLADLAVKNSPEDAITYIILGNIHNLQGNSSAALENFNQVISLTPESAIAYYLRAKIWSQQRNTNNAIMDLTQAISLSPNFAEAHLARGIALRERGEPQATDDFNQAIRIYTEVIRLNPNGAVAYFSRGKAYLQVGNTRGSFSDWLQAAKLLRKQGIKSTISQCQQSSRANFRDLLCR